MFDSAVWQATQQPETLRHEIQVGDKLWQSVRGYGIVFSYQKLLDQMEWEDFFDLFEYGDDP